ncbi:MAG: hypothetical protein WBB89_15680 [Candidatus Acidiferrum sp.]
MISLGALTALSSYTLSQNPGYHTEYLRDPGNGLRFPGIAHPAAANCRRRRSLAVKIYRQVRTGTATLEDVLAESLTEYQSPISPEVMAFQIEIAASEATALEFVPPVFRRKSSK